MNERPGPPRPTQRRRNSVRVKILALVVAAALAPALLVGATSYYTAQSILLDKTNGQLATRTESALALVESWVSERKQDVDIFASSFVVTENLAPAAAGAPIPAARIADYLQKVQERFPLYRALFVLDGRGRTIAKAGSPETAPALPAGVGAAHLLWLEGSGDQPFLYVEQPIRSGEQTAGTLVTLAALGSLWQRLSADSAADPAELHLATPTASATFPSLVDLPTWRMERTAHLEDCKGPGPVISRYRTAGGVDVLGACRAAKALDVVVIEELDATTAFASIRELRNRVLLISLVGVLLVTGLGYALVVNLIRPIEALVDGARAVSDGDYAHEVKIASRDELGYLGSVFNEMTRALRATHGELEHMSRTDELTGLFNRRHLDAALEAELVRARRDRSPLGVVMLDIDHFKTFNDRFGHPEGDALLRAVAELLREQVRPTDTVARYGGEEFMVLLPHSPREEAVRIAERMRRRLSELRAGPAGSGPTTGSFGVASWPEDGDTSTQLIAAADGALYEAKRQGRDRIVLAGVSESES